MVLAWEWSDKRVRPLPSDELYVRPPVCPGPEKALGIALLYNALLGIPLYSKLEDYYQEKACDGLF